MLVCYVEFKKPRARKFNHLYTDRLYKSFAMFPDNTLTNGIELIKE